MTHKIEIIVTDLETNQKTITEFRAEYVEYEIEREPRKLGGPHIDSPRTRVEWSDPPHSITMKGTHLVTDPKSGAYLTQTKEERGWRADE